MNAFHTNWTKPFFTRVDHGAYYIEDFEILATILSALEWQRYNGDIKMYTDEAGAEYYSDLGLEHIWNLGIDTSLESEMSDEIDPANFWAAGKVLALQKQSTPCIMMDTDFIVLKPIMDILGDVQFAVFHREELYENCYPGKLYFKMTENYKFPVEWDWTVEPCNTSLTYIADEGFKDYYTNQSLYFMKNFRGEYDRTTSMIFAEQRIISMCAKKLGIPVKVLQNLRNVDMKVKECFYHVWIYKTTLMTNPSKREKFCMLFIRKLFHDFPEIKETISKIKCLEPYCKEANDDKGEYKDEFTG